MRLPAPLPVEGPWELSVSADQEDHVSMGPNAVRKFREILDNVCGVLAIEMMCAAQSFDRPLAEEHRDPWA